MYKVSHLRKITSTDTELRHNWLSVVLGVRICS